MMTSLSRLLVLTLLLGQTTGFLFNWFTKNYVCAPTCTKVFCPYGFLEKGCPRCQCALNPCRLGACQPGFRCETKPTDCAVVYRCPHEAVCVADRRRVCSATCAEKDCPYGFLEQGCPRCECAENPCKANTCNTVFEDCISVPVECESREACPHQYQCVLRTTRQLDVPRVPDCSDTCPHLVCPYGFSDSGCPRCTCAPNPCNKMECRNGLTCHARESECKHKVHCPFKAECRDTACEEYCPDKYCPFGFMMEGCPRCTCAPDPCMTKKCDAGFSCVAEPSKCRFQNNCFHIAVCHENVCSDVCPNKICPFGFQLKGCPRCECVVNPCSTFRCPPGQGCTTEYADCEFGVNCPKVPVCKSVCKETSKRACPYGFLSQGCPRSTCAPNPCTGFSCPGNQVCEAIPSDCELSYGCPYKAVCKPRQACEATCRIGCVYGMLSEGCPRCQCAPNPCTNFSCLWGSCKPTPTKCPFNFNCPHQATCVAACEATCRKQCLYGFLNEGCPRCTCAPNPCQGRCEVGASCSTKPTGCPFRTGCPHQANCHKSRKGHRCLAKMHPGNCRRGVSITRYYYNPTTKRCERFRYSGCGGNANNFTTYWTCLMQCAFMF